MDHWWCGYVGSGVDDIGCVSKVGAGMNGERGRKRKTVNYSAQLVVSM